MLHKNVEGSIESCFYGMQEFGIGIIQDRSGTTRMTPLGLDLQGGE